MLDLVTYFLKIRNHFIEVFMNDPNQNTFFSIYKGIGIILIVIGHAALYTPIYYFVYLFHITIFFFVAGYFFKDKHIENPLLFLKKKLIRYYIPWVIFGVVFVLLHNIFLKYSLISYNSHTKIDFLPYDTVDIAKKILSVLSFFGWKEPLLAPLWFLFGMFSGLMVFFSISFIAKKISIKNFEIIRSLLVSIILIIGFIGSTYKLPLGLIYRPMVIAALIYLGKLYAIFQHKIRISYTIGVLCFVGLVVATSFKYYINIGGMVFGNHILFLLISTAGCYMILVLTSYIVNNHKRLSKALAFIGEYSFSIMVLHYFIFKIPMLIQIAISDYPIKYLGYYPIIPYNTAYYWILYTFFGVSISLLLGYSYNKVISKLNLILK